ncbi:PilZ domain-containing protein [Tsuneonella sp. HG249]
MDCATACHVEELIGRRESTRHRVDLSARFVSSQVSLRVQLEDISTTGACIRLKCPRKLEAGRLFWLNSKAFGRIIWQNDLRCGVAFDEPLRDDVVEQALQFAELMANDTTEKFGKLASAWVHGPGDW